VSTQPAESAAITPEAPANDKNTLNIRDLAAKPRARLLAELGLSPILANTNTTRSFAKYTAGELDITEAVAVMREKAGAVTAGNLAGLEETLTAQAVALDAIFNEMARRAAANMRDYVNAAEIFLRLGLKAQAQCRATLQTLFEMKNPQPVAFVKQANIAHGPQQVNNGAAASGSSSRAKKPANKSNELLGVTHEQRLDKGTAAATGGPYSELAAVGAFQRSEERPG
jgi:hypothetical protein